MTVVALVAASAVVAMVLARIGRAAGRTRPRVARRPEGSDSPESLRQLERVVRGAAWASELHLRLRPILREIADAAMSRRAIDPAREPARAAALLGADLWELVRPDRDPPREAFATGLDRDQLAVVLARLEEL